MHCLRPCRVGLLAAGRRRPDGRVHARTDGQTHGGSRARTARASAPRPAREGWGRAQILFGMERGPTEHLLSFLRVVREFLNRIFIWLLP
ncbi:G-Protein Coupled Receptor-Associated Sorting Protein 2 [Manis pentadactyla]|nr:G-Protein Coupled Receptor-Associated Sorting Protein 2 [Manis pentadactyla]